MRSGRNHLPAQNAHDSNFFGFQSIKDYMLSLLMTSKTWTDGIAASTHFQILGENLKSILQNLGHIGQPAPRPRIQKCSER
jgi:hypothetical protein